MAAIPLQNQDINVIHSLDFKSYDNSFDTRDEEGNLITWAKLAKKGTALSTIASIENERVGFAVWERGAKDKAAYIVRLGVRPDFRRRGIARQILGWIADDLREAGKKELRVVLSQVTCLGPRDPDDVSSFMKKVGFEWIDTIPDNFYHYGKNEDGLVFKRSLV